MEIPIAKIVSAEMIQLVLGRIRNRNEIYLLRRIRMKIRIASNILLAIVIILQLSSCSEDVTQGAKVAKECRKLPYNNIRILDYPPNVWTGRLCIKCQNSMKTLSTNGNEYLYKLVAKETYKWMETFLRYEYLPAREFVADNIKLHSDATIEGENNKKRIVDYATLSYEMNPKTGKIRIYITQTGGYNSEICYCIKYDELYDHSLSSSDKSTILENAKRIFLIPDYMTYDMFRITEHSGDRYMISEYLKHNISQSAHEIRKTFPYATMVVIIQKDRLCVIFRKYEKDVNQMAKPPGASEWFEWNERKGKFDELRNNKQKIENGKSNDNREAIEARIIKENIEIDQKYADIRKRRGKYRSEEKRLDEIKYLVKEFIEHKWTEEETEIKTRKKLAIAIVKIASREDSAEIRAQMIEELYKMISPVKAKNEGIRSGDDYKELQNELEKAYGERIGSVEYVNIIDRICRKTKESKIVAMRIAGNRSVDLEKRRKLILALAQCNDKDLLVPLFEVIMANDDPEIRRYAMMGVKRIIKD